MGFVRALLAQPPEPRDCLIRLGQACQGTFPYVFVTFILHMMLCYLKYLLLQSHQAMRPILFTKH